MSLGLSPMTSVKKIHLLWCYLWKLFNSLFYHFFWVQTWNQIISDKEYFWTPWGSGILCHTLGTFCNPQYGLNLCCLNLSKVFLGLTVHLNCLAMRIWNPDAKLVSGTMFSVLCGKDYVYPNTLLWVLCSSPGSFTFGVFSIWFYLEYAVREKLSSVFINSMGFQVVSPVCHWTLTSHFPSFFWRCPEIVSIIHNISSQLSYV